MAAGRFKKTLIIFFPIMFLQIYLAITLVIFSFGPISFELPHPLVFWLLIIVYHLSFLYGYMVAYWTRGRRQKSFKHDHVGDRHSLVFFYVLLALAFVSSALSLKNANSISQIFNPVFWFEAVLDGITNPGDAYKVKMERVKEGVGGNKLLNSLAFFIAYSKVMLVPFVVFFWSRLSFPIKGLSVFVTLLPALGALSQGTNKAIFDFVIIYGFSLVSLFLYNKFNFGEYEVRRRKFFVVILILAFFGALTFFGTVMSERGGDLTFIETQDGLGNVRVEESAKLKSNQSFFYYTFAWLSSYVVQGYYGLSLALTQDFQSTFGVGSSSFIMRNVESLLGVDIGNRTYQFKIDKWWGEHSQWHSFYSHFANDFHFIGVSVVCFFVAYWMGCAWFSFLYAGNIFSGALMPIFFLLIVFIPANNQVFGFFDGLSAFIASFLFWFISTRKFKF